MSGFHRRTTAAEITWGISLLAVVVTSVFLSRFAPRVHKRDRPATIRRLVHWIVLAALAVTWDLLALDTGPRQPHLTLSALTQAFRPLNASVYVVWMLVGIGYGWSRGAHERPAADTEATAPTGVVPVVLFSHLAPPALLLPSERGVGVGFWVGIAVLALLIELAAQRWPQQFAPAGEVARAISQRRGVEIIAVLAWAGVGFHLFCV